ncbi:MAG: preprotein translocase subunit YajC [Spirochaetales bacterium]|nr:preprotein translocase subunit YajC [Spirochaetales bacterium]
MAAPGADGSSGSIVPTLVTFGLVFVIFYFLIIRPQNKKKKDAAELLKALKKGDRVVSIGGIHGTIQSLKDDTVVLKVDGSTKITMSRSAVSTVGEQSRPTKKAAEKPVDDVETEEPAADSAEAASDSDE